MDWGRAVKGVGSDVSDWLGLSTPEFDYSSEELRKRWQPQDIYQTPGTTGATYGSQVEARGRGYGPSPAERRQQQALSAATAAGAATGAARQRQMGAGGALTAALAAQQAGAQQALAAGTQQRGAEQARGQADYLGFLKAATGEQIAQDKINAAYSQLNLEALLAEQEARRKQKGGLFGGIGGMLASIFG